MTPTALPAIASSSVGDVGFSRTCDGGIVMAGSVGDGAVVVTVIDGRENTSEAETVGDTVEVKVRLCLSCFEILLITRGME